MNENNQYNDLLKRYPDYMSKEQMYQECHISKKTCRYLLQSGLVPSVMGGKKEDRYRIRTVDVITYLKQRELYPARFKAPAGFYKKKAVPGELPRDLSSRDYEIMRLFYLSELRAFPDVLTVSQINSFTGYCTSAVVRWCKLHYLKSLMVGGRYRIPKQFFIDFLVSWKYIGIDKKSSRHKQMNNQICLLLKSHN